MNLEKKLSNLEQEIMLQVEEECDKIREEYNTKKNDMISKAELAILNDNYTKIQKEKKQIEKNKNSKILSVATENKQKLTIKRGQIIDTVFKKVDEKITAFLNSEEYVPYLRKTIDSILYAFPNENIQITINRNDQKYQDELKNYNKNIAVIELSHQDIIGGMIVTGLKSGKTYDSSFENIIYNERKNFLRNNKI